MTEEQIEIILNKLAEIRKMILENKEENDPYNGKNFKAVYRNNGNDYPITGKVFKDVHDDDVYLLATNHCDHFWVLTQFQSSKAVKEGYNYGWYVKKSDFSLTDIYEFEII